MSEMRIEVRQPAREGGHYALINCRDLVSNALGEDNTEFWKAGTKEEYRQLVTDSQDFFEKIESGEIDADSGRYFVYGDTNRKSLGAYIHKVSTRIFNVGVWVSDPVLVYRDGKVYRHRGGGGAHRFAAARGMDLMMLVYVDGE